MIANLTAAFVKKITPQEKPYEAVDESLTGFLLRIQPSGQKTYFYSYRRPDGRRARVRIGTYPSITASVARKAAEQYAAEVVQGGDPQQAKKEARSKLEKSRLASLNGFMANRYSSWALAHQKRGEETLKLIQRKFEHLGTKRLEDITSWDIQSWRSRQSKAGMKPATINRAVSALKALLNKAVEWNAIPVNPLDKIKPLKLDSSARIRYLSRQEEEALRVVLAERNAEIRAGRDSGNAWREARGYDTFSTIDERYSDYLEPIVILALNTGMRRGEIFNLRWSDVDADRSQLIIEGSTAKSGHSRHIPLNREAMQVLSDWQSSSRGTLVFPNPATGEKLDNIKTSWTNLRKRAGIADFRFHDLRHTFASKLVMAGVDLYTVKELLGHSTIQMTEKYAHLAPEHNAEAVERISFPNSNVRKFVKRKSP